VHANPALSPHGPDLLHPVMSVDFVQCIMPTIYRSLTQVSPLSTQCNISTMFDLLIRHDHLGSLPTTYLHTSLFMNRPLFHCIVFSSNGLDVAEALSNLEQGV